MDKHLPLFLLKQVFIYCMDLFTPQI